MAHDVCIYPKIIVKIVAAAYTSLENIMYHVYCAASELIFVFLTDIQGRNTAIGILMEKKIQYLDRFIT